ncbi:MAG: SpoIIE family protein phosphatase [Deltaproteobacteria bacterium]|nr:SpoIIE family protein phosphatase [Deltaproteobacteria bacterium]MDQ3294975.1 SpoIIE family protein phosphatase [Myxococcota bacterium]
MSLGQRFVARVRGLDIGILPTDSPEQRLAKAGLVITATGMGLVAVFYAVAFLLVDRQISGWIPGAYSIVSVISIVAFAVTKRYEVFRFSQIILILFLPFCLQWSLGGFAQSGSMAGFGFLAIVGALVFHGTRQALWWYLGFIGLLIFSAIIDSYLRARVLPLGSAAITLMGAANIIGTTVTIFFVVRYTLDRSQRTLEEVREQRMAAEVAGQKIAEQAEQLKEVDRAKTLFFANVSHELRTPLTLLLGPLQSTLGEKGLTDDQRRRLTLASRNGRRLMRQINLLLDITKAEAGQMKLDLSTQDPVDIARLVVEESTPAARARQIEMTLRAVGQVGLVEVDRDRIDQILLNLVSNAIKFTPEGGRIEVRVEREDQQIIYTVADTGIGIPAAEIPNLFQSFKQAQRVGGDNAAAMYRQDHQGTGLGLALAKQLVELHGGMIAVHNQPVGTGSIFVVRLPIVVSGATATAPATEAFTRTNRAQVDLADIEAQLPAETVPAKSVSADDGVVRPRVLVVDDHADVRTFLRDVLGSRYQIIDACDGQQGIDRALAERPDLIISDVMMPRRSGFELVEELKANRHTRAIPIILLTARGGSERAVEGLQRGADDYLSKPFDPAELVARVGSLLRMTKLERELSEINSVMEEELQAAQLIQASLMPSEGPVMPGLDVGGDMISATQLGGDFFDFLPFTTTTGDRRLGIAIGDVTGHGAGSALVTAVAQASMQTNTNVDSLPVNVLNALNQVILGSTKGKRLMTFFYGLFDVRTQTLRYANAGHTFPWILNARTRSVKPLTQPGVPLGLDHGSKFNERSVTLTSGDTLVLFSDGVIEAEKEGKAYGIKRLQKLIWDKHELPARGIAQEVIQDALRFCEQRKPNDDMTTIVMKLS